MITEDRINIELSKIMLKQNDTIIQPNLCYNNVFELTKCYKKQFINEELFICYGYWGNKDTIFLRHGYIMNSKNEVIDPTVLLTSKEETIKNNIHYTFAKLPYKKCLEIIDNHSYTSEDILPDFAIYLKNEERQFYKFAVKNNFTIWHDSYTQYLKKFDKDEKLNVCYGFD